MKYWQRPCPLFAALRLAVLAISMYCEVKSARGTDGVDGQLAGGHPVGPLRTRDVVGLVHESYS